MAASLYITFAITVSEKYNVFLTLLKNPQCRPYNDRTVFTCRSFLDFKSSNNTNCPIMQEIVLVKNPLTYEIVFL